MDERLIDTYVSSVRALWPGEPGPRLHRSRGPGRAPSGTGEQDGGDVELMVLPNAQSPRLLVPAGNAAAGARAMLRFSAALSVGDTVKRLGVSALLRTRAGAAFPDRITVAERAGSLRLHLGEVFGEPVDLSLGLGTARANRKPVLQVFDTRGRSLAFVKIGDTEVTRDLVRAEAAALQRLGETELPPVLEVPRLLHLGTWEGATVLAMTALETSFRQRPSRQFEIPTVEMAQLATAFAEPGTTLEDSDLWRSMAATVNGLRQPTVRERFGAALEVLRERAAGRPLSLGGWHGDWTPWNMSRLRGRLQLWDWERFETGVPLGLDRCHYAVNAVTRRDGVDQASIRRGLELAGVRDDAGDADHLLGATYLAAITSRYLAGAESERGEAIADRSREMLTALTGWLRMPAEITRG